MGKKDTLTKEYMADNHIFADAFNYFMFDGGNVIHAEDLRERDSTEMAITYERNQKISPVQKNRDHLIPVITVVIYFGADEWDAPRSLHEMFDEDSKAFLSLVPDYKLNIIAPANMTNDEINKFRTELREVLLFVKYSKDKAQLAGLLADDEGFKNLDRKTAQLINVLTHSDLKVEESEGDGKVCIAWEGIKADIREAVRPEVKEEVREEVIAEVREEVRAEVREEVIAEVRAEVKAELEAEVRNKVEAELIVSLLKSKLLSYEQISDMTRMPVSELKNLELAG